MSREPSAPTFSIEAIVRPADINFLQFVMADWDTPSAANDDPSWDVPANSGSADATWGANDGANDAGATSGVFGGDTNGHATEGGGGGGGCFSCGQTGSVHFPGDKQCDKP